MIKHGFYKTLEMMANQFEPYETRLRQLPESQRQIDFEHEPTPEAVEMFMAIPRFSLFSDFFMNKDVEKGLGAACINAYHHDASMMIPKTYARLWQFARRSDHWVNLLELSSGSITNPDFFINFCAALKNQNNRICLANF